jgi:hypothetical protein
MFGLKWEKFFMEVVSKVDQIIIQKCNQGLVTLVKGYFPLLGNIAKTGLDVSLNESELKH